ncbi:MAG: hypothetical protein K2X27_04240 [Candidatus Obscuribacterales bacterium]|nr:hypothetical protein [Candidatus Obscuribacterales bacterium]
MLNTTGPSSLPAIAADKFFPGLHGWITAAKLQYQPRYVTDGAIKALAVVQTMGYPFYTCQCGDFQENAKRLCDAAAVQPEVLRGAIRLKNGNNQYFYPQFAIRQDDAHVAKSYYPDLLSNRFMRVLVSGSWGLFHIPGWRLVESWKGLCLDEQWRQFAADPVAQVVYVMQMLDDALQANGNDLEAAYTVFDRGLNGDASAKTSFFAHKAMLTYKRLINQGHPVQ